MGRHPSLNLASGIIFVVCELVDLAALEMPWRLALKLVAPFVICDGDCSRTSPAFSSAAGRSCS
jgi:hypothetical protein